MPLSTMFLSPKFEKGEEHVHSCPECYDDETCILGCSHHLDIDYSIGPPKRGSHCVCMVCEKVEAP